MRICKQIDPVIDIVIIGFGVRSQLFVDKFLRKNELKGVNIIIICKDNFVFLDDYVQCEETCRESYTDVYNFCKNRNILFINEKVHYVHTESRSIFFASDRNPLNYDFMLCDFDFKSSDLFNTDMSHMNIYPFRNKNLFFYHVHVMYLALMQSTKKEEKRTDVRLYRQCKRALLQAIPLKRFLNFYSYNDRYVDDIFSVYGEAKLSPSISDGGAHMRSEVAAGYPINGKSIFVDAPLEGNRADEDATPRILLISDNNPFGKCLYSEMDKQLRRISAQVHLLYVHVASSEKEKLDFPCRDYLLVREIRGVKEEGEIKEIKFVDIHDKEIIIRYDECINITGMRYPSYVLSFGGDATKCLSVNTFCQCTTDDYLYLLNQIKNYDDYAVCETVYLNIYNKVHGNEYISIEHVKDYILTGDADDELGVSYLLPPTPNLFNHTVNYSYRIVSYILRRSYSYISRNRFLQNGVVSIMYRKREIEKYINGCIASGGREVFSSPSIRTFSLPILKRASHYVELLRGRLLSGDRTNIPIYGQRESHKDDEPSALNRSDSGSTAASRSGSNNRNEEVSIRKKCAPSGSSQRERRTNSSLPEYMYRAYEEEYERRLLVSKETAYRVYQEEGENGTTITIIVQDGSVHKGTPSHSDTKREKVNSYIKESIEKIINRNTCGGCGSKVPSNVLSNSLKGLSVYNSPNVFLGIEACDDCCIFVHSKSKRGEESPALVQTIDFFKSFIDDEYILGEIIAIHCLSDVYSMGGTGICALCVLIVKDNIEKKLQQRLQNILTGCCQKLKEEKCVLSGGHTCAGNENYVGLAVTGKVKKRRISNVDTPREDCKDKLYKEKRRKGEVNPRKSGTVTSGVRNEEQIGLPEDDLPLVSKEHRDAFERHQMMKENYLFLPKGSGSVKAGDIIITTKMFGFGFIMAAHICKKAKARWIYICLDEMLLSNRKSGLYLLQNNNAKACTDVTGFGILGHLNEMIKCSRREIYFASHMKKKSLHTTSQRKILEGRNKRMDDGENDQVKEPPMNLIGAKINLKSFIVAEGVEECIENNIFSSMYKKNHYLCNNIINLEEASLSERYGLLFDPQTSGGLMAIVERERAHQILADLKNMGYSNCSAVGEIINVQDYKFKGVPINQVSLDDYLDTTNSVYIEC
ncbi:selenophosphate synthase, putative [Plasmodium knowlesi strain H]|uniref:Selenophosphate synthase, putative n=3 Tax=Plasmodium knowlesi TaxID=5850 RepID=A0A5K1V9J8_PLAKH|nr:selenide water dikinase, putative [Plasmodium knowlesi strain H]OTN67493.1 putative Selenophosphate synthase [Plasmodium knowlesi]CAA9987374.1 selenide water dikinase, putative [Plasmodium knowlesi strain H]SBO23334.1 selenophosphate synthase, putative [Plasmodium knowlesi strain H]SBO24445.1 selenophosphate synthase, putative [Plasmodium knowlesi strain H]VVS76848.1 selenide water dikinase, putative [Plasmodium knowlesi strain H]|eukprot:XP_002258377.1 selenophosphate synthase, putative [Plasmodium knowlesi strain H]